MLLSNIGLRRRVAKTPGQYVELAGAMAADLPRLAGIRAESRRRFRRCPVADGPGFARDLGDAYRRIWREWCAGREAGR